MTSIWQPTTWLAAYRRRRFAGLFVSLLLTFGAGGTLQALVPAVNPLLVLLALSLLAAVASVAQEGAMRLPLVLAVAWLAVRGVLAALGIPGMLAVSEAMWVMVIMLVTIAAARYAFTARDVDAEHILAALDAYLLVGLLFGVAYQMLDHAWPGSFGAALDLPSALYFSFVTIATLGYGDVVPVSAPARGLAVVEGVSGQLYLAVLVARLVSLYARRRD